MIVHIKIKRLRFSCLAYLSNLSVRNANAHACLSLATNPFFLSYAGPRPQIATQLPLFQAVPLCNIHPQQGELSPINSLTHPHQSPKSLSQAMHQSTPRPSNRSSQSPNQSFHPLFSGPRCRSRPCHHQTTGPESARTQTSGSKSCRRGAEPVRPAAGRRALRRGHGEERGARAAQAARCQAALAGRPGAAE